MVTAFSIPLQLGTSTRRVVMRNDVIHSRRLVSSGTTCLLSSLQFGSADEKDDGEVEEDVASRTARWEKIYR